MIQRIQSLYLLIAGLLITSLCFLDLAEIYYNGDIFIFNAFGLFKGEEMIQDGLPILLFTAFIALLHLIIIFLFKKRILQIRITIFTVILILGLYGLYYFYTYPMFDSGDIVFRIPLAFPLVAIVLDYLAIRGIGKDEALVRSLDRIR